MYVVNLRVASNLCKEPLKHQCVRKRDVGEFVTILLGHDACSCSCSCTALLQRWRSSESCCSRSSATRCRAVQLIGLLIRCLRLVIN